MDIHEATTTEEILAVARFMKQFEGATEHVKVNPEHAARTYENFIRQGTAVFLVLENEGVMIGGLGAIKYPDIHDGRLTAVECFWFVAPQFRGGMAGIRLFDAFEKWGKQEGCSKLAMIHLVDSFPEKLERIYTKRGYRLVEKHYVKEI